MSARLATMLVAAFIVASLGGPAVATPPDTVPEVTITSVTLGDFYQDPVWPDVHGCQVTIEVSTAGLPKGPVYLGVDVLSDATIPPWSDVRDMRVARGQTDSTIDVLWGINDVSGVHAFRASVYKLTRKGWDPTQIVLATSADYPVEWEPCQP